MRLLEQRRLLGGRAGSFAHAIGTSPAGLLDNSQHVLLGCCTELQSLYERLGVSHLIRFDDALHFADGRGRRAEMRAAALPSPLHLAPAMIGFELLHFGQKMEIMRAMGQMKVGGEALRQSVEDISFAEYLGGVQQSPTTLRDYWDVICISALNEPCASASAKYALQVFQEAFLAHRGGYRLGYARRPLSMLYQHLPGVEVRPGSGVRELVESGGRVVGVRTTAGKVMHGEHIVLATSPAGAIALLRPLLHLDERLRCIERLEFRPILGAHMLYDRPLPIAHPTALVGTHLQWAFVDEQRPELLHGVVSAADQLPADVAFAELFDGELRRVFGDLGGARMVDAVMVKENSATFRPMPGVDRHRPTQRTRIPGLTLAGDYTRTEWPATMEGAARSGRLAAELVLSR